MKKLEELGISPAPWKCLKGDQRGMREVAHRCGTKANWLSNVVDSWIDEIDAKESEVEK